MSINSETLQIANVEIDVIRKDIKNMHLAVYPPLGKIRLAVPKKTDEEILRLFAISKLGWIKKHVKTLNHSHEKLKEIMCLVKVTIIKGRDIFWRLMKKMAIVKCC